MSIARYQNALENAILRYETQHNHQLSLRRQKDVAELKAILQNEANPRVMKRELLTRLAKVETGWWIFRTGRSDLKNYLLQAIHAPEYALDKVLGEELRLRQQQLFEEQIQHEKEVKRLQAENNVLKAKLEAQQKTLDEKVQQLKVFQQVSGKERAYFTYEDYLINLMDKFMHRMALSEIEAEHLNQVIDYAYSQYRDAACSFPEIFANKVSEACNFAFKVLVNGIDYLIQGKELDVPVFLCIEKFADHYVYLIKDNSNAEFYFHRQMNKLMHSYYKDGADKTVVCNLEPHHKAKVLETKENIISLYGDKTQTEAMIPFCELRRDSRFEEFKNRCIKKGKELYEWLHKKKKPESSLAEKEENVGAMKPKNSSETPIEVDATQLKLS